MSDSSTVTMRGKVCPEDRDNVRNILRSSGFFHSHEIDVAVELVDENLAKGTVASGYHFIFAENGGSACLGFACHGPIACTVGSYDLFWIAVAEPMRGKGLGELLLRQAEAEVIAAGGRKIYIETSGRELYAPTWKFYRKCGYELEARLQDFYDTGDDKLVFVRTLA